MPTGRGAGGLGVDGLRAGAAVLPGASVRRRLGAAAARYLSLTPARPPDTGPIRPPRGKRWPGDPPPGNAALVSAPVAPLALLPPAQRAVLALVLEHGKSYAEIARLLKLDVESVRDRTHQALDGLAPAGARGPLPDRRAAIGDYLLGQDPDHAPQTFVFLENSAPGRDWARALAEQLGEITPATLPPIPSGPGEPRPAAAPPTPESPPILPPAPATPRPPEAGPKDPPAPPARAPSPPARGAPAVSRRGGALLLIGGVVVIAAVAAVLFLRGGSTPHRAAPAVTTPQTRVAAQFTLTPVFGSPARGLAAVILRAGQPYIAIAAGGLRPTSAHLAYGVWLYNSRADAQLIGFSPPVKANGKISALAALPAGASRFGSLVLTREAGRRSTTTPGPTLLSGRIPASAG